MNRDGQSGRLNSRPGKTFLLFMISALMLGAFAPDVNAGPNDVSAAIAVSPGDHNLTIPSIPDGAAVSHITVTITAASGWTIVQLDPAPSGWYGTYQRLYDGTAPGEAYSALFSGKLKPDRVGETGEGLPGEEPDYTFRVHATGTSLTPEYYIQPPEQVVCVGESATFTAYKNVPPVTTEISNWTIDNVSQASSDASKTFTLDVPRAYNISAQSVNEPTLSDTATLIVLEVDSLSPNSNPYEIDDEDNNPDTRLFVVDVSTTAGDVVTVTATPNPNVAERQLPAGWTLTGGIGTSKLHRTIDRTTPSKTVLRCVCGTSSKETTIFVAQCTFSAMSDRGQVGHAWWRFGLEPLSALEGIIRHCGDDLTVFVNRDAGFFPLHEGHLHDDGQVVTGDQGHPTEARHDWTIPFDHFLAGVKDADAWKKTPGMYDGDTRNCVWGAIRIGNASDIPMPTFKYTPPLWPAINGFWHPNHFADWLDLVP